MIEKAYIYLKRLIFRCWNGPACAEIYEVHPVLPPSGRCRVQICSYKFVFDLIE